MIGRAKQSVMNLPIRVLIADNDIQFSQRLGMFLDNQPGIKVVAKVRDGQGAVDTSKEALPDVILMDLHLPVLDSIRAIRAILDQNDRIRILCFSSIQNDRYAIEAVKVGASGCLAKDDSKTNYEAIINAIQEVVEGEVLLNPALASSILKEFYRLAE
jgi:DNA-binding NarL/FixJ family response regulator